MRSAKALAKRILTLPSSYADKEKMLVNMFEQVRREQHAATCQEFETLFCCYGLVSFEDTIKEKD